MKLASNRETFGKVGLHSRDCQRCGRGFEAKRVVPYCPSCYREKHGAAHRT